MQTFDQFWDSVIKYSLYRRYEIHDYKANIREANGCGAKGGKKFPDTMWFVSILPACIIHDIEWHLATCYQDLLDANGRFDDNLKRITDRNSANKFMRWLRRYRIASYVNGVELIGTKNEAKKRGFHVISV